MPLTDAQPATTEASADVRWLDEEEMATWIALMSFVLRLPSQLDRQLQRDECLSRFEYMVLAGLSQSEGHTLRMTELATFTDGQLSRLSQVVGRMEQRGWLTRCSDPTDGRATLATLTAAGLAKVSHAAPGHVTEVRNLVFDRLSRTQVRTLGEICRQLVDPASC